MPDGDDTATSADATDGTDADDGADATDSTDADDGADVTDSTDADDGATATDGAAGGGSAEAAAGSREDLTHVAEGEASMVDVGAKPDSARRAVARGRLALTPASVAAIRADAVEKGDVLATARVGAVQAVKHAWETIPLCHQIPITNVDTDFRVDDDGVTLSVAVETTGKTGCEMEALEGVTTGLNVVFDMVKAVEKDDDGAYPTARIEAVRVVEKTKRTIEE